MTYGAVVSVGPVTAMLPVVPARVQPGAPPSDGAAVGHHPGDRPGLTMSLCDRCTKPGACCNDLVICGPTWPGGTVWADGWREQAIENLEKVIPIHPFIPLRLRLVEGDERDPRATAPYGMVHWACKNIQPDGRCGDYENRPQLCRNYEPASDRLCVMYVPPADTPILNQDEGIS